MVKGIERFREHFSEYGDTFVVIGGVACDGWFSSLCLHFRATRDVDMVLIAEALSPAFKEKFWEFVKAGGYEIRQRADGSPIYYRFSKPTEADYPAMLELFSRQPEGIDLAEDQTVVPISGDAETSSMSAILIDDTYYEMILEHRTGIEGLPVIGPVGLIPLKARAWLDMTRRREAGEHVNDHDLKKHRSDVFRLAATLPAEGGPNLAQPIQDDLREFVASFPPDSEDWIAIRNSLENALPGTIPGAEQLLEALGTYFQLQ